MLESLFNNVAKLKDCNFIKERLQHRCFPVNNAKFLTTHFLQNTCGGCFNVWANIAPVNFLCNVVTAVFGQRGQKQPFADVLQNKCP